MHPRLYYTMKLFSQIVLCLNTSGVNFLSLTPGSLVQVDEVNLHLVFILIASRGSLSSMTPTGTHPLQLGNTKGGPENADPRHRSGAGGGAWEGQPRRDWSKRLSSASLSQQTTVESMSIRFWKSSAPCSQGFGFKGCLFLEMCGILPNLQTRALARPVPGGCSQQAGTTAQKVLAGLQLLQQISLTVFFPPSSDLT